MDDQQGSGVKWKPRCRLGTGACKKAVGWYIPRRSSWNHPVDGLYISSSDDVSFPRL